MLREDLTGKKFGRLLISSYVGRNHRRQSIWSCICDCGNSITVVSTQLKVGKTKSCGCLRVETTAIQGRKMKTHGRSETLLYRTWGSMLKRCNNPKDKGYINYGGRGITVCQRWQESFENFLEDMGERPEGLTLERKNNNLGYFKDNCKWADRKEQQNNRRGVIPKDVILKMKGNSLTHIGVLFGVNHQTVSNVLNRLVIE